MLFWGFPLLQRSLLCQALPPLAPLVPGLDPDELELALVQGPGEPQLDVFDFIPADEQPIEPVLPMPVPVPVYVIGVEAPDDEVDIIILN